MIRTRGEGEKQGRVSIIGLGPGAQEWRTLACQKTLAEADDIIGYGFYLDQIGGVGAHQTLHYSDNGEELARAKLALDLAAQKRHVVLVSSGDPGVFAMAAAFFEILEELRPHAPIDIVVEPGITAALSAAARFGAPLGGDFAVLSLSDNLKPWNLIEKRLRLLAQADMALALYNPVSKARPHQIERTEKPPSTLIGLGTDIARKGEKTQLTTLEKLNISVITSRTVILVGTNMSRHFSHQGRDWFYTPRSYTC